MSIIKIVREELKKLKPYIPGKHMDELKRELGLSEIIKLASNENPLGPSKQAIKAAKKAIKESHLYPDSYCYYLKTALSEKLGVNNSNIIIGNGSDEIIKLLGETFLSQGDEVITPHPSFSEYIFASNLMGAEVKKVELKDYTVDLNRLYESLTEKTKMVFVCNPNNPTGTIVKKQELENFLDRVPQDVVVVIDEAYYEYVEDPAYPNGIDYINSGKKVVVLRTFSKIYGLAGLRIGYAVASEELVQWITRVKEPFNVNSIAQVSALAALDDDKHLEQSKNLVKTEREYLNNSFSKMGLNFIPSHTNFIMVDVKTDSTQVFQKLLKQGIIVRSGDIFDMPTWIRISLGTRIQNRKLVQTLTRVLEFDFEKAAAF